MSFKTYMIRVLTDMVNTWDDAGSEVVLLLSPTEKEIDVAFDSIQSQADRRDTVNGISAFRLLQLEE